MKSSFFSTQAEKFLERELAVVILDHGEIGSRSRRAGRGITAGLRGRSGVTAVRRRKASVRIAVALGIAEIDIVGNDLRAAALVALLIGLVAVL